MRAARLSAALVTLTLVAGCSTDAPTLTAPGAPHLAADGARCYAVAFTTDMSGSFPTFAGPMTGDLEGTLRLVQDGRTVVFPNEILARVDGTVDIEVTGGSVPALVGRSLRGSVVSWNRFASDGDPERAEVGGRVKGVDGGEALNLTMHGWVDGIDPTPPFQVYLEWHGVICP